MNQVIFIPVLTLLALIVTEIYLLAVERARMIDSVFKKDFLIILIYIIYVVYTMSPFFILPNSHLMIVLLPMFNSVLYLFLNFKRAKKILGRKERFTKIGRRRGSYSEG